MRILSGLVLMLALLVSGCGGGNNAATSSGGDAPVGSNAQPNEDEDAAAQEEPASESAPDNEEPTFGDTVTWPNGMSMTVGKPKSFKPTEYASYMGNNTDFVRFQVTIVNNTGDAVDPSGFYTTLQSGDQEMEEIFDEGGLNGSPTTRLLDGRQARFDIGYDAAVPDDLVLQIDLGLYDEETGETLTDPVVFATQ